MGQSLEESPGELAGIADAISVILPWGSLLRAVVLPDDQLLCKLRKLGKPNAEITIVFGYGPVADAAQIKALGLPMIDVQKLKNAYGNADICGISIDEIRALPSKWAKK